MNETGTKGTALSGRRTPRKRPSAKVAPAKTVTAVKQRCWPWLVTARYHPTKPDIIRRSFRKLPDLSGYSWVSTAFQWPVVLSIPVGGSTKFGPFVITRNAK